jgi:hypothetical protein
MSKVSFHFREKKVRFHLDERKIPFYFGGKKRPRFTLAPFHLDGKKRPGSACMAKGYPPAFFLFYLTPSGVFFVLITPRN